MKKVDPVAEAADYQALLLSLVGDDDPAGVQARTSDALPALVREAGTHLRARAGEQEWSVLELLGHFLDAEIMAAARYRWILAHDRPPLMPYDQDLLVARLRHNEAEPDELVEFFQGVRRGNLALWRRMPAGERGRVGIHAERGPESYELVFRLMAGHDRFHLDQIRQTLAAVRSSG